MTAMTNAVITRRTNARGESALMSSLGAPASASRDASLRRAADQRATRLRIDGHEPRVDGLMRDGRGGRRDRGRAGRDYPRCRAAPGPRTPPERSPPPPDTI